MALDASDRVEIYELYARAAISFDTGDADGFAESFTRDGTFVASTDLTGREALAEYVRRRFREAPGTAHHVFNVLIEESGAGVRGRAYGLITGWGPTDGSRSGRPEPMTTSWSERTAAGGSRGAGPPRA